MTLMMALFIVSAAHEVTAGCGGLYGNAAIWVREADLIVRARAVEETPLPARVLGMSSQALRDRRDAEGDGVVRESEESVAADVGTYVVNQRGGPVAAEVVISSVKRE